jgi:MFS family permease
MRQDPRDPSSDDRIADSAGPPRPLLPSTLRVWSLTAAGTVAAAVGLGTVTSHGVLVAALAPATVVGIDAGAVLVAVSSTLQFGLGPLVGRMAGRYGVDRVVLLGAIAFGAGVGTAAATDLIGVAVPAYALGTGLAAACTLAPLLAAAASWHPRWRMVAVAVVSAGNGLGALLLGPWLAGSIAIRGLTATWTTVAVGGSGLLLVSSMVLRTPVQHTTPAGPWRLRQVLADLPLRRFYLAAVLGSTGLIAALTYLVPFGQHLGLEPTQAARLLGTVGAVGIISRLLVAAIPAPASYRAYRASQLALAASAAAWILAPVAPALLAGYAIVFGLAAGLWSALAPLVVAERHPDQLTSVLSLLYTAPAIGGALGALLGGLLHTVAPGASLGLLIAACFLTARAILLPLGGPPSSGGHDRCWRARSGSPPRGRARRRPVPRRVRRPGRSAVA